MDGATALDQVIVDWTGPPAELVRLTTKEYEPALGGVPEMRPEEDSVAQTGKPLTTANVIG